MYADFANPTCPSLFLDEPDESSILATHIYYLNAMGNCTGYQHVN